MLALLLLIAVLPLLAVLMGLLGGMGHIGGAAHRGPKEPKLSQSLVIGLDSSHVTTPSSRRHLNSGDRV